MKRRLVPDFTLLALALALSIFGLAMVYSAGQTDVLTRVTTLWHRQLLWGAIGLVAAVLAGGASVRLLDWVAPPLYGVTCVVLLLLIFIGKGFGTGASTKSWLAIGGFRLGQPSEIAKIVVVLMLAKVLAPPCGAAAHPGGGPGHRPVARGEHHRLGSMVSAPDRARVLVPPVHRGGSVRGGRERGDGSRGAVGVGEAQPVSAAATAGVPGSRLRSAALGLSRDSVAGGDRVGRMAGEGVHDGDAEAARVSAGAAYGFHFPGGW